MLDPLPLLQLSFQIPYKKNNKLNRQKITEEMFNEICELTPFIHEDKGELAARVFCLEHNITEYPKCLECGKNVHWAYSKHKFSDFCSRNCILKTDILKEKKKETSLKNWGVENPAQCAEIQEKAKKTNLERRGVEHPSQSPDVRAKVVMTCLERYGVDNIAKSEIIKQKMKETSKEKYGVEYPFQSDIVKQKITSTKIERYGEEYPPASQELKDRLSILKNAHYNKRRNDEGTDYSGVVYILHFKELGAVKIGLTHSSTSSRFEHLRKEFGDFDIIHILETDTCYQLESELHEKFKEHRICLSKGVGRTEFFNEHILDLIATSDI